MDVNSLSKGIIYCDGGGDGRAICCSCILYDTLLISVGTLSVTMLVVSIHMHICTYFYKHVHMQ